MKKIVLLLLLISGVAYGSNFELRVTEGKESASTPQGAKYEKEMGPFIGKTMRACIPPDSKSTANLGTFTLVGYVDPSGKVLAVEVQPLTEVSKCFASQFQKQLLPTPPKISKTSSRFPITIEMSVVP